jgi:chromosome segregation ATPase
MIELKKTVEDIKSYLMNEDNSNMQVGAMSPNNQHHNNSDEKVINILVRTCKQHEVKISDLESGLLSLAEANRKYQSKGKNEYVKILNEMKSKFTEVLDMLEKRDKPTSTQQVMHTESNMKSINDKEKEYKDKINELNKVISTEDHAKHVLAESKSRLEGKLEELQNRIRDMSQTDASRVIKMQELTIQYETIEQSKQQLLRDKIELEKNLEHERNSINMLQNKLYLTESKLQEEKNTKVGLENTNSSLRNELESAKVNIEMLQSSLNNERSKHEEREMSLKRELGEVKQALEHSMKQSEHIKLQTQSAVNTEMQQLITDRNKIFLELEHLKSQIHAKTVNLNDIQNEKKALSEQLTIIQNTVLNEKNKNMELNNKLTMLQSQYDSNIVERNRLTSVIDNEKNIRYQLESKYAQLENFIKLQNFEKNEKKGNDMLSDEKILTKGNNSTPDKQLQLHQQQGVNESMVSEVDKKEADNSYTDDNALMMTLPELSPSPRKQSNYNSPKHPTSRIAETDSNTVSSNHSRNSEYTTKTEKKVEYSKPKEYTLQEEVNLLSDAVKKAEKNLEKATKKKNVLKNEIKEWLKAFELEHDRGPYPEEKEKVADKYIAYNEVSVSSRSRSYYALLRYFIYSMCSVYYF